MSLSTDIANDYLIFDGQTTDVTLHQVRSDGQFTATVSNATESPLTRRQVASMQGGLTGKERNWSLNTTQVGSRGVEVGDKIVTADDDWWNVVQASLATLETRWSCICQLQER